MVNPDGKTDRRGFFRDGARTVGSIALGTAAGFLAGRKGRKDEYVWQIDPDQCMACGNCATYCVLDISAVKAVQFYPMCGL